MDNPKPGRDDSDVEHIPDERVDVEPPRKRGRQSKYKPEYCETVILHGKDGKSRTWIAAQLNVTRDTMRNWTREHPEFAEALELSQMYAQQWWEDFGQNNLLTKEFKVAAWSRTMSARFKEDWREEKSITIEPVDVSTIPTDELRAYVEAGRRIWSHLLTDADRDDDDLA
jgi:transposase